MIEVRDAIASLLDNMSLEEFARKRGVTATEDCEPENVAEI